ncbi:MAG: hypothetical protein A3B25_03310 [Candidatus Ryanbacteria bacterium RIFCSPLOWO2_01_FULL_48_26]|uniref:GP-PDE domain-containing protein n=1 Tax=Candidatus Ryanbacteria bacterium RIFCSPLOWO2_01_FULL_48_26 TaxID=1802126 RepID=A0A1G2GTK9_9BACT|nr:MAG: hypothetical protein A3B25_03310 [Candidatus Ryanbacteria bacterium RIFCSPLOWO2_01_FULL_48_26]
MLIIEHRINTISGLKKVPSEHGVEIDVRYDNRTGSLYLNHDLGEGEDLEAYLQNFHHAFITFNIKEAGIENRCIALAAKYGISKSKYFLLDVEFFYLFCASRQDGVREIAVRYSEAEPIEMALSQKGFVDWAWIDVCTRLPLDAAAVQALKGFKTCLVSPDRWGRPQDIPVYIEQMKKLNFKLDAVMVGGEHAHLWA